MNQVDLHTHTYYSDGRPAPQELVEAAAARGLAALAITDHDNARGAREARPLARQLGLRLIPGIEFSTSWPEARMPPGESDVDLLGYFLDIDSPGVLRAEEAALADQRVRIGVWCDRLSRAGIGVQVEELLTLNPRFPGNLQLSQLLKARGHTGEALNPLLESIMKEIPSAQLTTEAAIALIHAAGGAAVLAHPAVSMVSWRGSLLDARALGMLVEMGLDGIEVQHFRLDEPTRVHFIALAGQFNLVMTGGSDEHGWPQGFPRLGSQPVSLETVSALEARALPHRPHLDSSPVTHP
jgi:3',5'-nucleoside bisphosphate phosphatase